MHTFLLLLLAGCGSATTAPSLHLAPFVPTDEPVLAESAYLEIRGGIEENVLVQNGTVSARPCENVPAVGRTPSELARDLERCSQSPFPVAVYVQTNGLQSVLIDGELVVRPWDGASLMTLLASLRCAEGSIEDIVVHRGEASVTIDPDALFAGDIRDATLQASDVIYVDTDDEGHCAPTQPPLAESHPFTPVPAPDRSHAGPCELFAERVSPSDAPVVCGLARSPEELRTCLDEHLSPSTNEPMSFIGGVIARCAAGANEERQRLVALGLGPAHPQILRAESDLVWAVSLEARQRMAEMRAVESLAIALERALLDGSDGAIERARRASLRSRLELHDVDACLASDMPADVRAAAATIVEIDRESAIDGVAYGAAHPVRLAQSQRRDEARRTLDLAISRALVEIH